MPELARAKKLLDEKILELEAASISLRYVIDQSNDGILLTNTAGVVLLANPAAEALFDRQPNDMLGESLGFPVEPGNNIEHTLPPSRHRKIPTVVSITVSEIHWHGQVANLLVLDDLTAWRHAEQSLRESENRFAQMAQSLKETFWVFDLDKKQLTYLSPAGQRQWGGLLAPGASVKRILEHVHPDDRQHLQDCFTHNAETGFSAERSECECRLIQPDGQVCWMLVRGSPIHNADGKVNQLAGIALDISDLRETQQSLQTANEQLIGWVHRLEQSAREIAILNEMSSLLSSGGSDDQSYPLVSSLSMRLFEGCSGGLYMLNPRSDMFDRAVAWGDVLVSANPVSTEQCWGMRLGRVHYHAPDSQDLVCEHLPLYGSLSTLCVPVMVEEQTIGLYLLVGDFSLPGGFGLQEQHIYLVSRHELALAAARIIGQAFASGTLQQRLREREQHDPHTGLLTRASLEFALGRELKQASPETSLGLAVLGLRGKPGGENSLRDLAEMLRRSMRKGDTLASLDGDTFALLMPGATLVDTTSKAEALAARVKQSLRLDLALGVAAHPDNGSSPAALLKFAETACQQHRRLLK